MEKMKVFLAQTFSEEEGPDAIEGKTIYLYASKEKIKKLAAFLAQVANYVENNDLCHMHFRDYTKGWNKDEYIDLAIDLVSEDT